MIEKRLAELEIRAGGSGNLAPSTSDTAFSPYNSVLTNELRFDLVGEFGSLDFTITETSSLDIAAQPYNNVFGMDMTYGLYDNSTIINGIRVAQADEYQLYQSDLGPGNYTINGGMPYVAEPIVDPVISDNPGYLVNVAAANLPYSNADTSTILNGKFSYTTYLSNLMPTEDIFINAGDHYSALPPPTLYDPQKLAGGSSVLSSSMDLHINQDTRLVDGVIFGTYIRPPVNYNVTLDGVPITSSPQQWTF